MLLQKVKEDDMDKIPLEKKELKELLNKCWMTHDAMWFYIVLPGF